MKCIKYHNGTIKRVTNHTAHTAVQYLKIAVYVPKSVWKQEVRDNHVAVPQPHPDMMFNIWATGEQKEGTK